MRRVDFLGLAVRALDSQESVARPHVAKEEFAARADLENARDLPRRANIAEARAGAAAILDLDVIDGEVVGAGHVRAPARDHSVQHEDRHDKGLGAAERQVAPSLWRNLE